MGNKNQFKIMRFINSLVPSGYGACVATFTSREFRSEKTSKKYIRVEPKIDDEKKIKINKNKNLIFILFTCFFLNTKSNAIPVNETMREPLAIVVVDGNVLGIKREDIFNEKFLFSNRTTQKLKSNPKSKRSKMMNLDTVHGK